MADRVSGRETAPAPATTLLTFLIADVRGYTAFTVAQGDEAAAQLASRFADLCGEAAEAHGGEVIELRGDEALLVFSSARQALRCAAKLQASFQKAVADDPSLPLRVGIGLDAGEAVPVKGGYRGAALNLAARLCSLAGAGEALASHAVIHLAGKFEGLAYTERGQVQLKGFADPVTVMELVPEESGGAVLESGAALPSQELPLGGFLGALPTNRLVGRDQQLAEVLAVAHKVESGQGQLVLLSGEPGAGKTRLAQEVTLHLRNRGFLLAAGRCYEAEQTVPYYPFLDALAMVYAAISPSLQREASQRWPYLGALLPELIGVPRAAGGSGQDQEQRVFRSVTAFLEAAAETSPIAVLLDDLHWADASSLKLLLHLARHTRTSRILLLGTYRDVEVGRQHPLEAALRDLSREGLMERVLVRRLEEEETSQLIAATMGEETISEEFTHLVHGRTDGNPFFVQQVLRVLVERGDIFRKNGVWDRRSVEAIEVPESIRSVIGQRLSRLSAEAQELLREASVLGPAMSFDDLLAMTGRPEEDLEGGIEEARAAGLVYEAGRDEYAFDHALTQQALYAELSSRHRRKLHRAAGEAIEELPERKREQRAAELARHFLEGDDPERALPYALVAGDQAARMFAHSEAEWQYRTAVELAREQENSEGEAAALEKLAAVLKIAGRYDEALEALEQVAELHRRLGNLDGEARVVQTISGVHFARGMLDDGLARVNHLLASRPGEEQPPTWRFLALSYQASPLIKAGRFEEVLSVLDEQLELLSALGSDQTFGSPEAARTQLTTVRAYMLRMAGRPNEALKTIDQAVRLAEELGDPDLLRMATMILGETYMFTGDFVRARAQFERNLETVRQMGNSGWTAYALAEVGWSHLWSGNRAEARSYLERAVAMSPRAVSWDAFPRVMLGELCLREGRWEEAGTYLLEALSVAEESQDPQWIEWVQIYLAELELLQGQPEEALGRLQSVPDRPAGYAGYEDFRELPSRLGWAYLELGDLARAEEILRTNLERTMAANTPLASLPTRLVLGMLLTRQCRWDEAEATFRIVVSDAPAMPYPHEEARGLYEWGRMCLARGDLEQAQERLTAALAIFRRLGAVPYVERAEQALAEIAPA